MRSMQWARWGVGGGIKILCLYLELVAVESLNNKIKNWLSVASCEKWTKLNKNCIKLVIFSCFFVQCLLHLHKPWFWKLVFL